MRGQGKTEGLHHRSLPVPAKVRIALGRAEERGRAGRLARARVEIVETVRRHALRPALCVLLQGAPSKPNFQDDRPRRWTEALDRAVDEIFFERLWRDLEIDEPVASSRWAAEVVELAGRQLEEAIRGAPIPAARYYRAVAAAQRVFRGAARKAFPDLYPSTKEGADADERRDHHADS